MLPESGRLEFDEFTTLAAKFIIEEDAEAMEKELREAFRLYDKEGKFTVLLWVLFSRTIWTSRATGIGEDSKACRYCWDSLMEIHDLVYLGVEGRKILSLILKTRTCDGFIWLRGRTSDGLLSTR